MIDIRPATAQDLPLRLAVSSQMSAQGWRDDFERCLADQAAGHRQILLAIDVTTGTPAGLAQVVWKPRYQPFLRLNIPEIQDVIVVPRFRRQGLGAALVQRCEALVKTAGHEMVGIGVGLGADYGAAQRLYARLGYVPDGAGACYDDIPVTPGTILRLDDDATLKLLKSL